ncbi:MAG: MerR family transcriptional regulator [Catenulispora sp.]|nr:MerR family transcriptional regulator [Catenulispora sp.]
MTIGEVAARFDLPTHVLRHWESVGLLSPARAVADRRRYTGDDLVRVASIVALKRAGMSLPDIGTFLATLHTPARKEVLRRNRDEVRAKLAALESALALIEAGLKCTHEDLTTCPSYQALLAHGDVPASGEETEPGTPRRARRS